MHTNSDPPILYFGTPVVLIGTLNEDGSDLLQCADRNIHMTDYDRIADAIDFHCPQGR